MTVERKWLMPIQSLERENFTRTLRSPSPGESPLGEGIEGDFPGPDSGEDVGWVERSDTHRPRTADRRKKQILRRGVYPEPYRGAPQNPQNDIATQSPMGETKVRGYFHLCRWA